MGGSILRGLRGGGEVRMMILGVREIFCFFRRKEEGYFRRKEEGGFGGRFLGGGFES